MNSFDHYQTQAMVFRKPTADNAYAVMGLCEEAGEVAGKFAKWRRDGTDPSVLKNDVVKELGDVLWMVAAIATDLNVNMGDVATANLNKLSQRLAKGTISGAGDER
jgi:NTP pyrophosphatase (non-canonical NTP hydrolase)